MRKKEAFENERYYGIQKFYKPQDAFYTMSDFWGEEGIYCGTGNLVVGEHHFLERILERIAEKLFDCEEKKVSKENCSYALGTSKSKTLDYLLDFNFFFFSARNQCFYTSRMEFKDDAVDEWNQRQWGYYYEIYSSYHFDKFVKYVREEIKRHKMTLGKIDRDYFWDDYLNGIFQCYVSDLLGEI
ncbi:MAG: hypothetical protein II559_08510 [Muribaculaceae bacterium]|nr:hypothetical protein [Muribaculaceae bacterium]